MRPGVGVCACVLWVFRTLCVPHFIVPPCGCVVVWLCGGGLRSYQLERRLTSGEVLAPPPDLGTLGVQPDDGSYKAWSVAASNAAWTQRPVRRLQDADDDARLKIEAESLAVSPQATVMADSVAGMYSPDTNVAHLRLSSCSRSTVTTAAGVDVSAATTPPVVRASASLVAPSLWCLRRSITIHFSDPSWRHGVVSIAETFPAAASGGNDLADSAEDTVTLSVSQPGVSTHAVQACTPLVPVSPTSFSHSRGESAAVPGPAVGVKTIRGRRGGLYLRWSPPDAVGAATHSPIIQYAAPAARCMQVDRALTCGVCATATLFGVWCACLSRSLPPAA